MASVSPASYESAQSEERMRSIVNHVIDGIITIDERGVVESFNPAAEKLFGYQRAEVIGRNVKLLMPEPLSQRARWLPHQLPGNRQRRSSASGAILGRRKDGSTFRWIWPSVNSSRRRAPAFTGIVRDITNRKTTGAELRQKVRMSWLRRDRQMERIPGKCWATNCNPLAPHAHALHLMKMPEANSEQVGQARDVLERQLQHTW